MTTYNQTILKRDAQNNVIQNSYYEDMQYRAEYIGGNLVYRGYARPNADEGDLVWQLALLAYDGSNHLISIDFPQASNGSPTSEFNFSWTSRASYTYGV